MRKCKLIISKEDLLKSEKEGYIQYKAPWWFRFLFLIKGELFIRYNRK